MTLNKGMKINELLIEKMLSPRQFSGYPKNKLGTDAQLKGNMKGPARAGDLVGKDDDLEERTDPKLCRSPKRLGRSDYSSCVSQGLRAHSSKGKGHTDGHGHYLKGHKAKSVHYGGDVKDYDGK